LQGLKNALSAAGARRADVCVGYFNLRGWRCIADEIEALPGDDGAAAGRLIVGMSRDAGHSVRAHYNGADEAITQREVVEAKKRFAADAAKQLTWGIPTATDEAGLRKLAAQLRGGKVTVKFFGAHPLHAKTTKITPWKNPCNKFRRRFCKSAHRYGRNGANHRRQQPPPTPGQGGF